MTFALNPTINQTQEMFEHRALLQNGTSAINATSRSSGIGTGIKIGISCGVIIPLILISIFGFFFLRHRRQNSTRSKLANGPSELYAGDEKTQFSYFCAADTKSEKKPEVPPKDPNIHGTSELTGYSPVELPASRFSATSYKEIPSPVSPEDTR